MKMLRLLVLGVCTVVFGLIGGTAWAAQPIMQVDIPFEFALQGGTLPSGSYVVQSDGARGTNLALRDFRNGEVTPLSIVTRLADLGSTTAALVFDKVGDKYFLSEIHVPKMDGYALQGAPSEHSHFKVTMTEPN